MANIEVCVKGSLIGKKVKLRALMANCSDTTQLSQRLANKLGLTQFKPVYVTNGTGQVDWCIKWKVSLIPVVFVATNSPTQKSIVSYPLINCNEDDAWWEMIIGRDCFRQDGEAFKIAFCEDDENPSPGPSYREGGHYMGHNIRFCGPSEVPENEFYEFSCADSDTVSRLAIHKSNRQLVVVFSDSDKIFQYSDLPIQLEQQIEQGLSKHEIMNTVKGTCFMEEIEVFPDSTLLWIVPGNDKQGGRRLKRH